MDIDLARTFLAVYETGNFNRAAEMIHVTQSTVSTRIQNLESQLGQMLFVRSRAGTEPTAAGRRFRVHAASLLRVWQHARQEVALPEDVEQVLAIGGQFTLWNDLLAGWLAWMQKKMAHVAIRAEVGFPEDLAQRLVSGDLDVAVMYAAPTLAGFLSEKLLDDRLVAVSTDERSGGPGAGGYVLVDWGAEFMAEHARAFPDAPLPSIRVSHGILALPYLLEHGGSGYFPQRSVRTLLEEGRLYRVKKAPVFVRPAFMLYPDDRADDEQFLATISGLRRQAAKMSRG